MFGINKGNTAGTVATNPMGTGIVPGNTAAFPQAPQLGILDQLKNGMTNMQANQAAQQAAMSPEQKMRQQTMQSMQSQGQQQPTQFSPVQFGGAANNGGALAQFLEALKKQGGM